MENAFLNLYLKNCQDDSVEPQANVIAAIKHLLLVTSSHKVLDLSNQCLTLETCSLLGKCIRKDFSFHELQLSDCMLAAPNLKCILDGLLENTYCSILTLKGNNIRDSSVDVIANLIKHNQSIKILSLEWNQLGISSSVFASFADALTTNQVIEQLDLRNNQLGHENARALSVALRKNRNLKSIDLRWNNIGVVGSKYLLETFDYNHSLLTLDAAGNNIPVDTLRLIEKACEHNKEMSHQVDFVRHQRSPPSESNKNPSRTNKKYENDIERTADHSSIGGGAKMDRFAQRSLEKVGKLEQMLDDRKSYYNQLNSKISMLESQLQIAEGRLKDTQLSSEKFKHERESMAHDHQQQLQKEKDLRLDAEKRLLKDKSDLLETVNRLESQIKDLERDVKRQQEEIFTQKEQLVNSSAEAKLRQLQQEEDKNHCVQQYRNDINDLHSTKNKELANAKEEFNRNEQYWKQKVNKLEEDGLDTQAELNRLRNQLVTEKQSADELLQTCKLKWRQEEQEKVQHVEEKLRMMTVARDELQSQATLQNSNVQEMRSRISSLELELETANRQREAVHEEQRQLKHTHQEEVHRQRDEWRDKLEKLEKEKDEKRDLYRQIDQHQKEIEDNQKVFKRELAIKNQEISRLEDQLNEKQLQLDAVLMEEQQRAGILQSAVAQFCAPRKIIKHTFNENNNNNDNTVRNLVADSNQHDL